MPQVGRPHALDEIKRREVCALLAAGCGIGFAARHVGGAPSTIRREALRNEEFYEQLRRSELAAQLNPLKAIQQAAGTHWRAAAWFLERTQPDMFGRSQRGMIDVEVLKDLLERLCEIVNHEIPDENLARKVHNRILAFFDIRAQQKWSIKKPRRDPARAKNFFPTLEDEEMRQAERDNEAFARQLEQMAQERAPDNAPKPE